MIRTADDDSCKTLLHRQKTETRMVGLSCVGVFWAVFSLVAAMTASFGFYMPYWLKGNLRGIPVYFGVFRRCNYPEFNIDGDLEIKQQCGRYSSFGDIPSLWWQIGTVAIGIGCGIAILIALIAILAICIKGILSPFITRLAGILQMCSGILVGGGVAIYPHGWGNEEIQQACGNQSQSYQFGTCTFYWAFYLTAAGAVLMLFSATLSCCANQRKRDRPYTDV